MRRIRVAATAKSSADPARVFTLLKDGSTWPDWAMFDSFELARPGVHEPHGVGAIRVFITKVSRAREEVVELVLDRRLSYVLLSGFPLREYRADVDLEPTNNGGTSISWRASFYPKYFGTGWFWRLFMMRVLATTATQLASAVERPTTLAHL
jgi:Polyketide cyclase / dehydrase and lipid transport